jgi:hypothetical protein
VPFAKAALRLLLLFHAVLAAAWWWGMPHGFPLLHGRTLANAVAPGLVLGLGVSLRSSRAAGATLAGLWLGAALGLLLAFPISGPRVAPWLALPAAAALAPALRSGRRRPRALLLLAGPVLTSFVLGVALPFTQRGPEPDTRPRLPPGSALPAPFEGWPAEPGPGPAFELRAAAESVGLELGPGRRVDVEPLLTFTSRSPDRCWTLLSTPDERRGPPRGVERVSARVVDYSSADGPAALRARARPGALEVEGLVSLGEPVFAHLARGSFVSITGLAAPSVRFDACPDVEVELRESDYPVGRPARFACFDGTTLRALEATSGEKGPFHLLAEGPLARGAPLGLTLLDGGAPVVHLAWLDFTAQAGLGLSPTAGWGAPVNALELHLERTPRSTRVRLHAELAATSIGRGWDSVGHAAGVYRERLVVRPLGRE